MTEYNKDNPFPAKIRERRLLNKEGSTKKTYHITLDLEPSHITYKVGDAIGIFPENPSDAVDSLLSAMRCTGKESIIDPRSKAPLALRHFLKTKVNLLRLTTPLIQQLNDPHLLRDTHKHERAQFIADHDLIDFFEMHHLNLPLQEVITYFAPLLPRFYSIASSPLTSPQSIDLLVATFTHAYGKKSRPGIGSDFLCAGARLDITPIPCYLHPTAHFTLPAPEAPILMIGPGTGVAPYRGFLQERVRLKAPGMNWLVFGERAAATDYYYQDFFEELQSKQLLRLDVAFSRDQHEKVYVQHKLLENSVDVWNLLQSGGYIYICGDARHMAKDVTLALHTIAEQEGRLSELEAKEYFKQLRRHKRLLLDVY